MFNKNAFQQLAEIEFNDKTTQFFKKLERIAAAFGQQRGFSAAVVIRRHE